jgi:hypothetical protein
MEHAVGHHSVFFADATGWGTLLFPGANIASRGAFAVALLLSFLYAFVVTAAADVCHRLEAAAGYPGASVAHVFAGAAAVAVRTGAHYVAMLLVMSFNVGVIFAVVGGHAVGWLALAWWRRSSVTAVRATETDNTRPSVSPAVNGSSAQCATNGDVINAVGARAAACKAGAVVDSGSQCECGPE